MQDKKIFMTGKYRSGTGVWEVAVTRDGRKAKAKGSTIVSAHKAAMAALALMEKMASEHA